MCVLSYPYLCWAPNSQWFPVVRDKLINPIPQGFILDINPFNKDSYYSRWDECIPNIRSWSTLAHNMKRCCWYYNLYIYTYIYMHIFALECGYVFFIVYINSYPLVRPRRPPYDTKQHSVQGSKTFFWIGSWAEEPWFLSRTFRTGGFPRGTHGSPWWL